MSEIPSSISRLQELLPQLFQSITIEGDRYLRYQLNSEVEALMPIENVRESLIVPREQITPLPQMSPSVMGLMSSRDRVFLAIDLPQLLNLSSTLIYSRQYYLLVINIAPFSQQNSVAELWLGLAVEKIQGILRVSQKPNTNMEKSILEQLEPKIIPYLDSWIRENEKYLPILDLAKIVQLTMSKNP